MDEQEILTAEEMRQQRLIAIASDKIFAEG
jgi:hypothetical protein